MRNIEVMQISEEVSIPANVYGPAGALENLENAVASDEIRAERLVSPAPVNESSRAKNVIKGTVALALATVALGTAGSFDMQDEKQRQAPAQTTEQVENSGNSNH